MDLIYEFKVERYQTKRYSEYCDIDQRPSSPHSVPGDLPFFFNINEITKPINNLVETLTDQKSFVSNYGNVNCDCRHDRYRLKVEKSEEKSSIKFYFYSNHRVVGKRYFVKNLFVRFITYNHKTNELYSGNCSINRKKKFNMLQKNAWYLNPLTTLSKVVFGYVKTIGQSFEEVDFNTTEINKCFNLFLKGIPNLDSSITNHDIRLYKHYLDGIGVKLPNNWDVFKPEFPQITKKLYRKNKFKFIDAYMSLYGLSGDKIKRVLHTVRSDKGICNLSFALVFFGQEFVLSQSDEIIKTIIEAPSIMNTDYVLTLGYNRLINFTKNERNNCFEIFKLVIGNLINRNTFLDHIDFKEKLNTFEPVTWKSRTYVEFNSEHFAWSEKVSKFKDPRYERFYNERIKDIIEEPIDNYYPVLLKTFQDYSLESIVQSNCVRTYNNRPESIIISIRVGDVNGDERASVEYKIEGNDDDIELIRVQSLGRFNKRLDESWNGCLKIMDDRINYLLNNDIFELPTYSVEYKGMKAEGRIIFDELKEIYMMPGQRGKKTHKTLRFDNNSIEIYKPTFNTIDYNDTPF